MSIFLDMETTLSLKNAGLYILDSMQRLQMKDIDSQEFREAMHYLRERLSEADYTAAKAWACARA